MILLLIYFGVVVEATGNDTAVSARLKQYYLCETHTGDHPPGGCPPQFDGWSCWYGTAGGHLARVPCPLAPDVLGAERLCSEDGSWTAAGYAACNNTGPNRRQGDSWPDFSHLAELARESPVDPYTDPVLESVFGACVDEILTMPYPSTSDNYCPRTFDGWGCWNDTAAGATAYNVCPSFVPGFSSAKLAFKVCDANGSWFRHPDTNKPWSNYTTCVDHDDLVFRRSINHLYILGYAVSVVALAAALFILLYFRALACTRTTIHKNLFASFVANNLLWIVWYLEVVEKPPVFIENNVSCQMLHVLVQFFLVSNYSWMFCEGLYLHTVLVASFVSESRLLHVFRVVGWGVPLVQIVAYVVLRSHSPRDTQFCWMNESPASTWTLVGPVCASLLLNLLFLVNIVRVLMTKLRAINCPETNHTRKAVRATLILIPLLGLHYLLVPFRPKPDAPWEKPYETITALLTSFQGFSVAMLFCFLNGEVLSTLRRKWHQARLVRDAGKKTSYIATSVSFIGRSPSEADAGKVPTILLSEMN